MSKQRTYSLSEEAPVTAPARYAAGLYEYNRARIHAFDSFLAAGRPAKRLAIGSSPRCDIVVRAKGVSAIHVILERGSHGCMMVRNNSKNGTYVDDQRIEEPVPLLVGMRICIAREQVFLALDEQKQFPLTINNLEEAYSVAYSTFGSYVAAGESLGCSDDTVKRHVESKQKKKR